MDEDEMHAPRSKSIVYSVEKAFRILEVFTSREPELLLSDVARRAQVDNATAFRMLNTLVMLRYVEKVPDSKRFRLTLKCLDLGFNAIARMDFLATARPVLQHLVSLGAGAASIGILDRGDVIYIERMQLGLRRLSVDIRIGTRIAAFSSAMGRAILAFLPEERQRKELDARPREKFTPFTETDLQHLLQRLRETREQGFALVDQESVVGLVAIAAPIVGFDDLPIAAISLATPSSAMPTGQFAAQFGEALRCAAATLSKAVQASGAVVGGP
jgi:IclR family pca regulon transcriptional regulator